MYVSACILKCVYMQTKKVTVHTLQGDHFYAASKKKSACRSGTRTYDICKLIILLKFHEIMHKNCFLKPQQNLTTVSIHSALSRSHIDVGRKWFCNFAVRQDDLPRRLVRVRPFRHGLRRGRMQQICYQRTKNQNPSHLGKSCSRL